MMPHNTIILVVVGVCVALIVFNFIFEAFRYVINIIVILALLIWVLYALGMINSLPNVSQLYDKIHNTISNIHY